MKAQDTQQAVGGFKTYEVFGGCVRVHEALDAAYQNTPHRYFISVNFKFSRHVALNIGTLGLLGDTKAGAMREARELAAKICSAVSVLDSAKKHAEENDNFTNRLTVKMQSERYDKLTSRYCAEFI